ncbi:MAG: hypothetical protein AB7G23_07440 [Vicinamibacterales bacterium]
MRHLLTAAAAPPAIWCAVLLEHVSSSADSLSRDVLGVLAVDALLGVAALLVVAAPLMGVAAVTTPRGVTGTGRPVSRWRGARHAVAAVAVLTGVSAALLVLAWGVGGDAGLGILRSHVTLTVAGLSLAAFGAACATWIRHPLDASLACLVVVVPVTAGVLAFGPVLEGLSPEGLERAMAASPVAMAAVTAGVDLFRVDPFYQISPVAHVTATYPDWRTACQLYLLAAIVSCGGILIGSRVLAPAPILKGSL